MRKCACARAGQHLNRPEVQRWAETVSRGSPVRSDAQRIPDSDDRPRRGKKTPSWQRQLVRVLRMNTSCTKSSASKALLPFTLFRVSGGAACSLTPHPKARTMRDTALHICADGCGVRTNPQTSRQVHLKWSEWPQFRSGLLSYFSST